MEQGPVLQSRGAAVAPVSSIAGQTRLTVTFLGSQGHAGTVPMHLRSDPLAGAAAVMHWLERRCSTGRSSASDVWEREADDSIDASAHGLVCTVGAISVWPGASNVIPGSVNISVDIR